MDLIDASPEPRSRQIWYDIVPVTVDAGTVLLKDPDSGLEYLQS